MFIEVSWACASQILQSLMVNKACRQTTTSRQQSQSNGERETWRTDDTCLTKREKAKGRQPERCMLDSAVG